MEAIYYIDLVTEANDNTYKCIHLYENNVKVKDFGTGDFVRDWYNLKKHFVLNVEAGSYVITQTSDLNHLDSYNINVKRVYLVLDKQEWKLYDLSRLELDQKEVIVELFIPLDKNWSWEEYKNYCEGKK